MGHMNTRIRTLSTLPFLFAALLCTASARGVDANSPVAAALTRADASVQRIVAIPDDQRTFDNTIGAIDDLVAQLELDTNMTMFMTYVSTDDEERRAGEQAEEEATNWLIDLHKREDLYRAVKVLADQPLHLQGEQKRFLEHLLRDYRRAGMELSSADREKLTEIQKEINRLGIEFEKNIRDDATRVPLTREELAGMSEDYLNSLTQTDGIYLVGLSYPEFLPLMDYCDNETTRKKVWIEYKRRGGQENVRLLERILKLRAEAAQLLGYPNAADYEIEIKMAKNAATVREFYAKLQPLVRQKAELDYQEFQDAKRRHTGDAQAKLYPWDYSFYEKKLLKEKYAVDSEKVKEYFPLDAVIDGLFAITQSLYGLEYRDVTSRAVSQGRPMWHEDVRLYEVWDKQSGELLGEFYIDLHPRENKYGHAAQWGLAQHKVWPDGSVTRPQAALVCNFTKPTPDKPSLLSHDEVETFFHEFGHCLHTILSEAHYWDFAGTSVERDFVEAPSQMFENWVWDADVLATFTRHYQTGEPLPPRCWRAWSRPGSSARA